MILLRVSNGNRNSTKTMGGEGLEVYVLVLMFLLYENTHFKKKKKKVTMKLFFYHLNWIKLLRYKQASAYLLCARVTEMTYLPPIKTRVTRILVFTCRNKRQSVIISIIVSKSFLYLS